MEVELLGNENKLCSQLAVLSLSPASVIFRLCDLGQILDDSELDFSA